MKSGWGQPSNRQDSATCTYPATPSPGAGPGGQSGRTLCRPERPAAAPGLPACWLLPQPADAGPQSPETCEDHLPQVGWSHLQVKRQVAEPPQARIGDGTPAPTLLLLTSGRAPHPLWCCRSLWVVLKLRQQLRSPAAAVTRYFLGRKASFPLTGPRSFPRPQGCQHYQPCPVGGRRGWCLGHHSLQVTVAL